MAAPTSTTSQRTSPLSLALVSVLSALLVVGVYQIRARLSKGHPAPPATALQSEGPEPTEAHGATPRTPFGENCDVLRARYTLQCVLGASPSTSGRAVNRRASSATITPENEAKELAEAFAWLHPPKDQLVDLARRCEVRSISPEVTGNQVPTVDDKDAKALALSSNERTELEQTLRQMHDSFADSVRQTYAAGAADPSGASSLTVEQMVEEIQDRPNSGFDEARPKLALERAGMAAPPAAGADLPPGERIFRLSAGLGDDFERRLADRFGADRARQLLYSPLAGWTTRSSQSGCPDPQ
jgi:hypothetical protein